MKHVTIHSVKGDFACWPANNGIWSWGNEILVGYQIGKYVHRDEPGRHSLKDGLLIRTQARSLDGGETWNQEHPEGLRLSPFTSKASPPGETKELILRMSRNGNHGGDSFYRYSSDRGRTWSGPIAIPLMGRRAIMARTEYLQHDGMFLVFLTARKPEGGEGYCFTALFDGTEWKYITKIGAIPKMGKGFRIMPAACRMPDRSILVAIRCSGGKEAGTQWIECYKGSSKGRTWKLLSRIMQGKGYGNPPTLTAIADGRVVAVFGHREDKPGIHARITEDKGKTWSESIVLREDAESWDLGYPRTVLRPDGNLVTCYYMTRPAHEMATIEATIWKP